MITPDRRKLTAIVSAGALALGAAACGDDDTTAAAPAAAEQAPAEQSVEQPQRVTGGVTTLRLDPTALRVLDAAGVGIEPTGEATLDDGRLTFPITEGSVDVDTLSGTIAHEGGLRFSAGGRSLEAGDLVIKPGADVLEAEVDGRRVPLLGVDLRALQAPTSDTIVLPGTAAVLSSDTVPALEDSLGVQLPPLDIELGRLQVSGKR